MKNQKNFGLKNTNFETPHGLDKPNHYTTAYELGILSNYALKNETFKKIVSTKTYKVKINDSEKTIKNTNELLGNIEGVYGVKTGFTNGANRCLVSCCKRNNLDIICVVLGADTKKFRTTDSINLINHVYKNYEEINIKKLILQEFEKWYKKNKSFFHIEKGINNEFEIGITNLENEYIPLNKKDIHNINIQISCNYSLIAPINKNTIIGNIKFKNNNKVLSKCNISILNTIKNKSPFQNLKHILKNYKLYLDFY